LALADIASWMPSLESGVQWNGITYTPEFVSGGFFSLDGFHPTQKGANLIANQFILAINAAYGSTFPTVYCEDCNGVLFP
jgi:lysophospholipase L1-like esterase